ncbi:hypothetical protein MTO96_036448 [Rhipicephalus appendiculatus]
MEPFRDFLGMLRLGASLSLLPSGGCERRKAFSALSARPVVTFPVAAASLRRERERCLRSSPGGHVFTGGGAPLRYCLLAPGD